MMMMSRDSEWGRAFAIVWLAASLLLSGGALADENEGAGKLELIALSTRPDMVSGGDVLVQVNVPAATRLDQVVISLNGRNVTSAFRAGAVPGSLVGLVEGLALGRNTLTVSSAGRGQRGAPTARLALVNHPITGPIFSGPQQQPFICETQTFGLGAPRDANCSAPTKVQYLYRSTKTNTFQPLDPNAPLPSDLAQTTTSTGNTVPYVVRRETGVINRAVYQIAFLHVPGQPLPDPWTSTPGLNNRLLYTFGGGCQAGYHQGRTTGQGFPLGNPNGVPDDLFLQNYAIGKGYAMATSSLNVFGTNCNEVLSAETLMMVKEYFIKRFGVPVYTIGNGASGGSMQQHLITHSYPGLMDGILPGFSFPDTLTFVVNSVSECVLLDQALTTSTLHWSDAQKTAIAGYHSFNYCTLNGPTWRALMLVPTTCDSAVPSALVYNAVSNPAGVRCTYADNLENVYGSDPVTGFARRALDNVGVQYGLTAFNAGIITAEQFIELNARVGGFDVDGAVQSGRTEGDLVALRIAYATGRLDSGGGGLGTVPIIDIRTYVDGFDDVHDAVRTDIMRARLIAANGHARNHVRLIAAPIGPLLDNLGLENNPTRKAWRDALDAMDAWLANIAADSAPYDTLLAKVTHNKPAGLVDACYTTSLERITDFSQCLQQFPSHANPRIAAGEPLTQYVLKCRLKRVNRSDYSWGLSDVQLAQLRAIFPDGVCDYSKPGFGQVEFDNTWLAFPQPGSGVRLDDGE
jgi:hypothetical protein